ncbi:Uncharacterised protein [Yersinia enterocolitica]|uniref:major capsid protein n=1 Tax=Yersinia enterocolitica TaxID=630 RepID=UPI0005E40927|nr:major capsid protein [Yersinia enterocolitica]CNH42178.1 Uncharacterised protein [Yersinia enterocolitica]
MPILSSMNSATPNQVVDLSSSFHLIPSPNYLLQNLKLFSFDPSTTRSTSLDYLVETNNYVDRETTRYGTDQNTSILPRMTNYEIEIPHFYRQDEVTPEAFQSRRRFGSSAELDANSVVISYLEAHSIAHHATRERLLAKALFKNTVDATNTRNPNINWEDTFGSQQQVDTVNLASASTDVPEFLDGVMVKLRSALGSLSVSQTDTLVFCGSSFYSKIRFHPSVKELYTFTSAADNGNNIITNYREAGNMPGISMFRFMDMTFIRVPDDSVYSVGADEAYFVPKFSELANPFRAIYGPASRHMDVAQMAPQEVFSYTTRDQMQMVSVHNEYSLLPVSQLPSVIVKVTNTTA